MKLTTGLEVQYLYREMRMRDSGVTFWRTRLKSHILKNYREKEAIPSRRMKTQTVGCCGYDPVIRVRSYFRLPTFFFSCTCNSFQQHCVALKQIFWNNPGNDIMFEASIIETSIALSIVRYEFCFVITKHVWYLYYHGFIRVTLKVVYKYTFVSTQTFFPRRMQQQLVHTVHVWRKGILNTW